MGTAAEKIVRIGGGSAFLIDSALAVPQLLRGGRLHYLIFDYLAEASMGLLGRFQAMDPKGGFGADFLTVHVGPHLAEIARQGVKVVANAGGLNPQGLVAALEAMIREQGLTLKVACVDGDDIRDQVAGLSAAGVREMFTGTVLPPRPLISANAYFGAFPIAAALSEGADIVITGRVVDSALALGPLIHEFGWGAHDYALLAAGTLAGHLLECGAQVTGGTFTDWRSVPAWEDIGFPIGECHADGTLVITKPEGTGGLVSVGTVAEQLLYEVSDPADYIVTDVRCDFSHVRLEQAGVNRVRVSGARGNPPTDSYKVCITYDDGWRAIAYQPMIGEEAAAKAERQAQALFSRARQLLRARELPDFTATSAIVIGAERSFGAHAQPGGGREIVSKLIVDHAQKLGADLFAREQWMAVSGMSPGTSINLATHVLPVTGLFLCLIPKSAATPRLSVGGKVREMPDIPGSAAALPAATAIPAASPGAAGEAVELVKLAYVRSGDKGHLFNVAVIARKPEYLPWLRAALTPAAVGQWYRHLRAAGAPRVDRYEVPGFNALNFVVHDSLEGGINASTQLDPAAKGMGQMLLRFPVAVPAALATSADAEPTSPEITPRRAQAMNDYSYLMKGLTRVPTNSSSLVSSSKYLNDPRIRDWLATHLLRKNGPDAPTPSDPIPLVLALREVQDIDHINELFAAERKKNAHLDAWFREGHISTFKRESLQDYPPYTAGGIFYRQLMDNDLQVDIVPPYKPANDYQYFFLRAGQTHDLEHILGGGGFDFIGEVVPYYMRLSNLFVHLSPELAGELCVFYMLSSTRILTRAVLHYPQTWLAVLDALERGAQVGRESGPLYSVKWEDVFELTPEEARIKCGIRGVRLADTAKASAQWC